MGKELPSSHLCTPLRGQIREQPSTKVTSRETLQSKKELDSQVCIVHSFCGFYTCSKSYWTGDSSLVQNQTLLGLRSFSPPHSFNWRSYEETLKKEKGALGALLPSFSFYPSGYFILTQGCFLSPLCSKKRACSHFCANFCPFSLLSP